MVCSLPRVAGFLSFGAVVGVAGLVGTLDAAVIDVFVEVDRPVLEVGESGLITVSARVKDEHAQANSGIFGWNVSVSNSDDSVVGLKADLLSRLGWDGTAGTTSPGKVRDWGIEAIYDTAESNSNRGIGGSVVLFTVPFEAIELGQSTIKVMPDRTTGTDFLTWAGGEGGDYTNSTAVITVVPEPTMFALMLLAGVATISMRRRFE